MAQAGYTPIQLYFSTTAAAVPTSGNLANGELGINITDEKLYFKNAAGVVKLLASNAASTGTVSSVAATVPAFLSIAGSPITTSGTLAITLSGTALPVANGGTGITSTPTNGQIPIGNGTTYTAATLTAGTGITITNTSGAITIASSGGGTVTSVGGTGTVSGISLSGTVTTSGNLTLGGALSLVSPPPIGSTTPNTGNFTTLTENSVAVVTQSDIGTDANEIPLNQYLGSLAYQNGDAYYNTGMTVGFRNRVINGDMRIDQRNAGANVTPTDGQYSVDRWVFGVSAASKFTFQQNAGSVTPPTGFTNYLGITSTSSYSIVSSDYFNFNQPIEGFNIADLAWGTANAKTVTLSFWVRSSLTGNFGGSIRNNGSSRSYPFIYTISSANTWEQKSIIIAGETTGTWLTNNGIGIRVSFGFGVGSNFSGTAGVWSSANYASATGATSVVGTNGATFYITGVQLEKGDIATSFDVRPYTTELQLCQRYCTTINDATTSGYIQGYGGGCRGTTYIGVTIPLPVAMRTTPSLSNVAGTVRLTVAGSKVDSASGSMTIGGVTPTIGYSANSGNLALTYIGGPVTGLTGIANDVCVTFFTNGDGKLFALSEL